MAGTALGQLVSLTGTRLLVWVADDGLPHLVSDAAYDWGGVRRPWGTAKRFADAATVLAQEGYATKKFPLLCTSAEFFSGDEGYVNASDAPPNIVRMKMKRTGGYRFVMEFPLLITANDTGTAGSSPDTSAIRGAYQVVDRCVRNSNNLSSEQGLTAYDISSNMIGVQDSYQSQMLPYILESFVINVSGLGQASPVSCNRSVRGIGQAADQLNSPAALAFLDSALMFPTRNPILGAASASSVFSRDIASFTPNNDPSLMTARVANIKDCSINLDGIVGPAAQDIQIVTMELKVDHGLDLQATSHYANNANPVDGHRFLTADHIYVSQRTVTGSFSFLASSAIIPDAAVGSNILRPAYSPFNRTKTGSSLGVQQWATAINMNFGSMNFNLPACYWQPTSHKLSSGSVLYTVRFVARTDDIYGKKEMR